MTPYLPLPLDLPSILPSTLQLCQYQTFLSRIENYNSFLIAMEDQWNKLPPTADEEEDTLLSHKLKTIAYPLHHKTLISSLSDHQELPFPPLEELFKPLFRNTCATVIVASNPLDHAFTPFSEQQKIRSNSSSIKRRTAYDFPQRPFQPIKKQPHPSHTLSQAKITYKFMKITSNDMRKCRSIYEESVISISDINGSGYLLLSDGRIMEGTWQEGVPKGCLKIKFPSGLIYYGPVYNYRQHGYGYLYFADGERYEGEFCYGEFHGEGVYYDKSGGIKKKGEWKRGKFIG